MCSKFTVIFCSLVACFAASGQSLSGNVVSNSGLPLVGANVWIEQLKRGTSTDTAGYFTFENLSPGTFQMRVSYLGYATELATVIIPDHMENQFLIIEMKPLASHLGELVVRATRVGSKMPFTYSNLKKEELEKNNLGQDVPFLLQWTPSAVVTSDAGAGIGYTGIRIRGTDPTRINVTINGIPLNDAESHNVFWVDLPDFASSTQDVQIQRGVGTSTNGSGVFGASIHLNTSALQREPFAEFNSSVGSFGTIKGNVLAGTGLLHEKFSVDGRFTRMVSEGYIDRARVDLSSLALSGAYFGKRHSIRVNLFSGEEQTYQAWNGVPAQYIDDDVLRTYNVSGTEKPGDPHPNEVDDYTQTHLQLLHTWQINPQWHLHLALHYTRGLGFFEQYKAGQSFERYGLSAPVIGTDTIFETDLVRRRWLDNHFFGATWAMQFDRRRLQVTLGGAWNRYLGDHFGEIIWAQYMPQNAQGFRYYEGRGEKSDFNIFGKLNFPFADKAAGFLDLQYRNVTHLIIGRNNDLRELDTDAVFHFFNPKIGLHIDLSASSNVYASFAVAHREPNRDDFTDAPIQSPPMPEKLYNTEAGFRRTGKRASYSINFYHMYYRDQLALTGAINDVGAPVRVNVPESYRLGIEAAGGLELIERLRLDGNLSLSRNKIKAFTEYIDHWDEGTQVTVAHRNTDLSFSPKLVGAAGLTCDILAGKTRHDLALTLSGKYVGKQFLDNTSNDHSALDPYFFSDLRIGYTWRPEGIGEISLTLLIQNLWDARFSSNGWIYRFLSDGYDPRSDDPFARLEAGSTYHLAGFYPQAGRNYLLGLKVRI